MNQATSPFAWPTRISGCAPSCWRVAEAVHHHSARQSLFREEVRNPDDQVGQAVTALQGSEARWRSVALLSVGGPSVALVAAIVALIVALAR
ncbi:MAG: hypothetical protein ABJD07_09970 [Gemmatimonadaceae bacterium]